MLQVGGTGFTTAAAQNLRVHVVDAQARHDVRVQLRHPAGACFAYDHVRDHEVGFGAAESMAGERRQRTNEFMRCLQRGFIDGQRLLQPRVVARSEQFKMLVDDDERERLCWRVEPMQLQRQAFGRRARTDAGRIEALQHAQRGLQLIDFDFEFGGQVEQDLVKRGREVALIVERFDQEDDEALVAHRQLERRELFHEEFAQALFGFAQLQWGAVVFVGLRLAGEVVEAPVRAVGAVIAVEIGAAVVAVVAVVGGVGIVRAVGRGRRRFSGQRRGVVVLQRVDRAVRADARGGVEPLVFPLQQRVLGQRLFNFLLQFDGR